jgi:hypothetical protein
MLVVFIKSLVLFLLALWFLKSIVDLVEYLKVKKQYKHGLGMASGTDFGMEVDMHTGESKTTGRPVGY